MNKCAQDPEIGDLLLPPLVHKQSAASATDRSSSPAAMTVSVISKPSNTPTVAMTYSNAGGGDSGFGSAGGGDFNQLVPSRSDLPTRLSGSFSAGNRESPDVYVPEAMPTKGVSCGLKRYIQYLDMIPFTSPFTQSI